MYFRKLPFDILLLHIVTDLINAWLGDGAVNTF
jgi:hypothetical protein